MVDEEAHHLCLKPATKPESGQNQLPHIYAKILACVAVLNSVAMAIANVFRKNRINVGNKFVRILNIFTKINDLKNCGVI